MLHGGVNKELNKESLKAFALKELPSCEISPNSISRKSISLTEIENFHGSIYLTTFIITAIFI